MENAKKHGILRELVVEVTNRCNYQCNYCYIHDLNGVFIPFERFKSIIQDAKDMGCIWLTITGGEPLLHPEILSILEYAAKNIRKITLFTNGSLLNERIITSIANKNNIDIEISLYGYDSISYDCFVGIEGSFYRFEHNLKLLSKTNINCILKTSICKSNMYMLEKLKDFAVKYNFAYRYDASTLIRMTDEQIHRSLNERLSPKEAAHLTVIQQGAAKEVVSLYTNPTYNRELYSCDGGIATALVSCDLHMSYCVAVRKPYYDLSNSESSLREGHAWLMKQRKQTLSKHDKCYCCRYYRFCGYCPGKFETETGSPKVPANWYCEFGKELLIQSLSILQGEKSADK